MNAVEHVPGEVAGLPPPLSVSLETVMARLGVKRTKIYEWLRYGLLERAGEKQPGAGIRITTESMLARERALYGGSRHAAPKQRRPRRASSQRTVESIRPRE